jgi:hypothetical protein
MLEPLRGAALLETWPCGRRVGHAASFTEPWCVGVKAPAQLKKRKILVPAIRSRDHDLMLSDF